MNKKKAAGQTCLIICLSLLSYFSFAQSTNEQVESLVKNRLEDQVAQYAAELGSSNYQIEVLSLPPLKLSPCLHLPEVGSASPSAKLIGRVIRMVTCSEPKWSLNIRARVDIFLPMVKSRDNIGRNTTIRPQDLILEEENLAHLKGSYFSSVKEVAGQRSRRQIMANRVIQPVMTEYPAMVTRNGVVIINAGHKGFSITMKGQALESGSMGEQVQIRNTSSGKVIMAEVTGHGTVSVMD